ncbi:MAG: TIGR02594 family protein [bacterium]
MRANLTAYSPVSPKAKVSKAKRKMEGGLESSRRGPDGEFKVRTLYDFNEHRSRFVTLAGNPRYYGKKYTITDIPVKLENGRWIVLEDVPAYVHDTGSAFKDTPEGRFDLPVGVDISDQLMVENAHRWEEYGIVLKDGWPNPFTTGDAERNIVYSDAPSADPFWVQIGEGMVGTKEIPGARDNPTVVALWELGKTGQHVYDDETPWCAAWVSAVLEMAHIKSARTGWARSYLTWGKSLPGPAYGAIVVFRRGSGGHVGFVVGRKGKNLMVLGGNQHNSVNVSEFTQDRVLGYRWPSDKPMPATTGVMTLDQL